MSILSKERNRLFYCFIFIRLFYCCRQHMPTSWPDSMNRIINLLFRKWVDLNVLIN